ncbi:uncharacterized protein METZ01_LOCUS504330, partial [marine metagenome]
MSINPNRISLKNVQNGFTMIELVIVVSVLGLML